jgi:antitoxin VapB
LHGHDWILDLVIKTVLLRRKRSQVVCLPEDVAFPDGVREVVVFQEGKRLVIVPADSSWDDFFEEPRIDIGEREQPVARR